MLHRYASEPTALIARFGLDNGDDVGMRDAIKAAAGADVAIVVVGERSCLTDDCISGESRDRLDIGLPGRQRELVAAVAATGSFFAETTVG